MQHPIHNDLLYAAEVWRQTKAQIPGASAHAIAKTVAPLLREGVHSVELQTPATAFVEVHGVNGKLALCAKCAEKPAGEAAMKQRLPRIDLHAHIYALPALGYVFECELPAWAANILPEEK